MNVIDIYKKYNTKDRCMRHLEIIKWGMHRTPICPHCEATNITKRKNRKWFYHCNSCNKDFTVLYDTIFERSNLPLPKWFVLITMMLNARKGISSMELHRQLGVTYKTAWYSAMRVHCAMIDEGFLLEGIIEADEVYLGGKPRKRNQQGMNSDNVAELSNITTKRGRGTKKVPVVGFVERDGKKRVVTEVTDRLTTKSMLALLRKYVNQEKSIIITDEARFYNKFEEVIQHLIIKHKERFAEGMINTNTIEGYWSIIKNGIRGEYHVLSKKYLPFYLAEFAYKYNRRSKEDKQQAFGETIERAVANESEMLNYKPEKNVREIVYGEKPRKKTSKKQKSVKKKEIKAGKIKDKKSIFLSKKGKVNRLKSKRRTKKIRHLNKRRLS